MNKGFTLIEVLIALIIIAIAFTALLETTRSNIHGSSVVQKKLGADWVGMNVIAEIQLGILEKPGAGSSIEGSDLMLNIAYTWTVTATSNTITVTVFQNGTPYQHITSFFK